MYGPADCRSCHSVACEEPAEHLVDLGNAVEAEVRFVPQVLDGDVAVGEALDVPLLLG
jgi:hypothetical protein